MAQNPEQLFKEFLRVYSQNNHAYGPRLPRKFENEYEVELRLRAAHFLEITSREQKPFLDNSTASNIQRVSSWLFSGKKRGLFLIGTCGNGKTTMLRSIKRLYGTKVSYRHAQEVYDHCLSTQGELLDKDAELLIIDDLGAEPPRCLIYGNEVHPLEKLLCYRYDKMRTTIIASNLGMKQIKSLYGERLNDRMKEMYDALIFHGDSYRGRKYDGKNE